jgi:hypothetical protein
MQRADFEDWRSIEWRNESTHGIHMETLMKSVDSDDGRYCYGRIHMEALLGNIIKTECNLYSTPRVAIQVKRVRGIYKELYVCVIDDFDPFSRYSIYGYGSLRVPLVIYKPCDINRTIFTKVPVVMHEHCWLLPGHSPMYDACAAMDVFYLISRYLSGWDIMALRVLCRRFSDFGSRNSVWFSIVSRLRAAMGPKTNYMFNMMPSMHRQFVRLSLCFNYQHRDGKNPRAAFMHGIESIMHSARYRPLLEFAVKQIHPTYLVRMIASTSVGKTKRKLDRSPAISCVRWGHIVINDEGGTTKLRIHFRASFAAGPMCTNGPSGSMAPIVWIPIDGDKLTIPDQNAPGCVRKPPRIEQLFVPFLRKVEEM